MKMAKPSERDINAAGNLMSLLHQIDRGDYPCLDEDKDVPDWFDEDNFEHLRAFYDAVKSTLHQGPGYPGRVIGGMCYVIMYDKNEIIDPDSDTIDLHPKLVRALEAAEQADPVAAQVGQVAPSEGWRLVPVEPTPFMVGASARAQLNADAETQANSMKIARVAYAAMLAAAPSAPAVAQQAPAQVEPGWISVDERLPEGRQCLATYRDRAGKLHIIRAKYVRQYEVEASGDECDGQSTEYNESDDTEYLKAGWLECIDNWGEYSSVYVCEGPVTHWMPLPAAPSPAKESK